MSKLPAPLVSIIMGVYNCEKTLPDAIESILNQTFQDFELIMCEDGSTDQTYAVAEQYARAHPDQIVLLRNEKNMGLNATLNRCLGVARGCYIARMDGDDRSLPQRLQFEVEFLNAHPEYALVSANLEVFDEGGVWGRTSFLPEPTVSDLIRHSSFSHSACMIRKSVFDEIGGYSVDKRLLRVEDKHLWYKIYAAGYRGRNLTQILYSYRDDREGYQKRKLKYRFNSFYVSSQVIRTFHLPVYYYLYAAKPILIGLLPYPVYMLLHKKKLKKNAAQP